MRHGKTGRRLGRKTSHREAMFRNMVTSLLTHEKITTTDSKAKEIRVVAERMITLGKRGDLHAMRLAASVIREKSVVTKLFSTIAPRYKDRPGGYTRIVKLGIRQGDAAPLSLIELVEEEMKPSKAKQVPIKTKSTPPVAKVVAAAVAPVEAVVEPVLDSPDVQSANVVVEESGEAKAE
jgi:large subunit ribosomal protein L17